MLNIQAESLDFDYYVYTEQKCVFAIVYQK